MAAAAGAYAAVPARGWAAGGWGCACCLPGDFDPVPGQRPPAAGALAGAPPAAAQGRRGHPLRGAPPLLCRPCAAAGAAAGASAAAPAEEVQRRDVVARGLSRFEIGEAAPHQPDWEQLSLRVICVLGQNPSDYTLNGTNCYLVGSGRRRLLIDTGEEHHGAEAFMDCLARCMEEHGVEALSGILITHMHHDHYGNIGNLQDKYGPLPVYTNAAQEGHHGLLLEVRNRGLEQHFLDEEGHPKFNLKGAKGRPGALPEGLDLQWAEAMVRHFPGISISQKVQYLYFFQWHSFQLTERLRQGVYEWRTLEDGETIHIEGATLTALHTPGHAPDHMSFLLEEEHALFSGDHVLGWGTTLVFDMRDYMATLRRMLELKPTRLYPGHGGFIKDGVDLLVRYIDHRQQREQQAWEALHRKSRPVHIREIARELYPSTPEDRIWMARDNVEKLFRKFAGDKSVAAWTTVRDASGTEQLVPFEVPEGYSVKRLPEGLLWAAKRSMVMQRNLQPPQPSKL